MPSAAEFSNLAGSVDAPGVDAAAITPDDNTNLTNTTRGLWVGGAGNVKVTMLGGGVVTFSGVAAGTLLPFRVARVWSTGTTATLMIGVY